MADMGITEVDATVAELVSATVQEYLIQESKLMDKVQNFVAPAGMDTIKIPKAGGFTPEAKGENSALTAQVLTYTTDDLAIDQHMANLVRLEDFASIQATPDIVSDIVMRSAKDLALDVDTKIAAQLELTSAAAPDHRVAYAGAAIAKADILGARELMHVQNVPFNECWIGVSPASEAALLAIADFVRADFYGSANVATGEIGKLYGARVVMSNVFDTAKTIVWHPTHCAFARQQEVKFETARDLPNVATEYLMSNLYGVKVLDAGKRGVMLGTAA